MDKKVLMAALFAVAACSVDNSQAAPPPPGPPPAPPRTPLDQLIKVVTPKVIASDVSNQ